MNNSVLQFFARVLIALLGTAPMGIAVILGLRTHGILFVLGAMVLVVIGYGATEELNKRLDTEDNNGALHNGEVAMIVGLLLLATAWATTDNPSGIYKPLAVIGALFAGGGAIFVGLLLRSTRRSFPVAF